MKLYVHHEAEPAFTKVLKVQPDHHVTVQDIIQEFVAAFNDKHASTSVQKLDSCRLQVFNGDHKPLSLSAKVSKVLQDQDDVFVEAATGAHTASGSTSSQTPTSTAATGAAPVQGGTAGSVQASTGNSVTGGKGTPASQSQSPSAAESSDLSEREQAAKLLHQYLERAHTAATAQNYRLAGEIYSQLLELLPDRPELLAPAAAMWLHQAKLPSRAEPLARRLVAAAPAASASHQLLGDCLMALKRPQEAVKCYDCALAAAKTLGEGSEREADIEVAAARALYDCGDDPQLHDIAAKITMDVLTKHESHWEGLKLYARIAEDQGMHVDALRVALRLLVARNEDAEVRQLLARRLQAPDGMQTLFQELSVPTDSASAQPPATAQATTSHSSATSSGGGTNNAAALAFLATCVKDMGAVDATITLLEKAVSLDLGHFGYRLNLAHAWELHQRLDRVVEVVASGMRWAADHNVTLCEGVDLKACAALLENLPPLKPTVTSLAWFDLNSQPPASTTTTATNHHGSEGSSPCPATAATATDTVANGLGALSLNSGHTGTSSVAKVRYSSSQLDLLALCFTGTKVLYVGGALDRARRLVHALLPARDASEQPLHATLIRNEAAYYGCVLQLVQDHMPSDPTASSTQPESARAPRSLFLLGDSHSLSPAWRTVTLRGERRLIHPVLVTGCKLWHLRSESSFYPKCQFRASVDALPRGSQVVMLLGEIDCREGLLLAVQKCKYDSTALGIEATVDIYMEVLQDLIINRGLEVFIHPVPPVLNETRAVVVPFNQTLKAKVLDLAATNRQVQGQLHWLEFVDDLLSPDRNALAAALQFDGTHLSPGYVTYLDRELAAIPR